MKDHATTILVGLAALIVGYFATGWLEKASDGDTAQVRAIVQEELKAATEAQERALGKPVTRSITDLEGRANLTDERMKNVVAGLEAIQGVLTVVVKE